MAEAVHGAAATATADAAEAEAPAVAAEAEPCLKEKMQRGAKGLPQHVTDSKQASGVVKYQARLRWLPQGAEKKRYDPIPGEHGTKYFATPEDAAAALATAQQLLDTVGAQAVWPDRLPSDPLPSGKQRAARGTAPPRTKGIRKAKAEKGPGIGRGKNPASHGNKPRKSAMPSDHLGQTVPLPKNRCTVCQHCIVDYLSEVCGMCTVPVGLPENEAGAAGSVRVLPPIPVALASE